MRSHIFAAAIVLLAAPSGVRAETPPAFFLKWGIPGSGNGEFGPFSPSGLATAPSGVVFVADYNNGRIQIFDAIGGYLGQWGSTGTGDGQFTGPFAVAVDRPTGAVYVAELGNRIQKFSSAGTYLLQWGSSGSSGGEFLAPVGIAVAPDGSVFVAERENNRVQKFDPSGGYLLQWGSEGSANGQFIQPLDIAVGPGGEVYVVDLGNGRIQKFSGTGNFIAKWDAAGSGDGEFSIPARLATDAAGNVYVIDAGNGRVQKLDPNGGFLAKWGTSGTANGQFQSPQGIAVAASGFIYVGDSDRNDVQMFVPATVDAGPPAPAPGRFALHASVPNPMVQYGSFALDLTDPAVLTVGIHDVSGRLVRQLARGGLRPAGTQHVTWDRRDDFGARVPAGMYFLTVTGPGLWGRTKIVVLN